MVILIGYDKLILYPLPSNKIWDLRNQIQYSLPLYHCTPIYTNSSFF